MEMQKSQPRVGVGNDASLGVGSCRHREIEASTYTNSGCPVRHDGKGGVGMPGGKSWTPNWLTFDNSHWANFCGSVAPGDG